MKKLIFLLLFLPFMCSFHAGERSSGCGFRVRFSGIGRAGGTVRLALYDQRAGFMVEEKAVLHSFKVEKAGTMEVAVEVQVPGDHAFAVFLDENNNRLLDKNLLGVPTEPYGFSKPPPSKWRLPTWDEVRFNIRGDGAVPVLAVELKKWAL